MRYNYSNFHINFLSDGVEKIACNISSCLTIRKYKLYFRVYLNSPLRCTINIDFIINIIISMPRIISHHILSLTIACVPLKHIFQETYMHENI